jgi:hypothetical protein
VLLLGCIGMEFSQPSWIALAFVFVYMALQNTPLDVWVICLLGHIPTGHQHLFVLYV